MARTVGRKAILEHERRAIAAEVNQLLAQDAEGRRRYTQTSLGEACGGLSHETIRLATSPDGVGPTVRDRILALVGLTIEQLMQKHGIQPNRVLGYSSPTPAFISPTPAFSPAGVTPLGGFQVPDRLHLAKGVISALERDGYTRDAAQAAVSDILFNGQREWTDVLDLYQQARNNLEMRGKQAPGAPSGERQIPERLAQRAKSAKPGGRKG